MWTPTTRLQHSRDELRYSTDLTDAEWGVIETAVCRPACRLGRPRLWSMREIVNGIFYVMRGGIAWRLLPKDLPPKSTVYGYFSAWRDSGLFAGINHHLVMLDREQAGRDASPSAAVLDSQKPMQDDGKRRPSGLRRGQEGEGAQASGPGGHGRPRPGARPAAGRHPRSRRSRAGAQAVAPLLPVHRQGLRRRRLCRRQAGGCHPHRRRDRPQAARTGRLRGPPTSMGGGALLRLDQPQSDGSGRTRRPPSPPPRPSSTPHPS